MVAYEQRSYSGNAADTVLNVDITSTALTFSVAPGTGAGYPDGSQGPFDVFIDYDTSGIEKVRCTGRVNDTFTIPDTGSRGIDGTTAQAHSANAKVRHGWTAIDAQESNRAAHYTVGAVTAKGDLLAGTGANALARVPAGANGTIPIFDSTQTAGVRAGANPSLVGATLDATSTVGGVSGTTLSVERGAWTAYSPGWSAGSTPTLGTNVGRSTQVGKTVTATGNVQASGTASSGTLTSNLPVAPRAGTSTSLPIGVFTWFIAATGVSRMGNVYWRNSGTQIGFQLDSSSSQINSAIAVNDALLFTVNYEAA